MSRALLALALGWLLAAAALAGPVGRESYQLDLGDFQARAELTYPRDAAGSVPVVVLVHGSGPEDMDATVFDLYSSSPQPSVLSAIFADLAEFLPAHGVAVFRYNKHYVTSAARVDVAAYMTRLTLARLVADVQVALDTVGRSPRVDPRRIYLLGLSEGTAVAAQVAVERRDVAGLILIGTVVLDWREGVKRQILEQGLPYLAPFCPGGRVTVGALRTAAYASGAPVSKSISAYLLDPSLWQTGRWQLRPVFDPDRDGSADLDRDVRANLDRYLDEEFSPGGYFHMFAPGVALPTLAGQVQALTGRRLPVLMVQGEFDSNCPTSAARELEEKLGEAGHPDHTLRVLPASGHSVGPARSLADDYYRPIRVEAMQEVADWVLARSR